MKRSHFALAALLFIASSFAVLAWHSDEPRRTATADQTDTASVLAPSTTAPRLSSARFQVGLEATYGLESSQTIELGETDSKTTLRLRGSWHQTVVGIEADSVRLRVHLASPTFTIVERQGAERPPQADSWQRELAQPFYLTLRPDGRVDGAFVAPGTSQFAEAMLLSVATTAQLVIPPDHGALWTVNEHDPTGTYEAQYQLRGGTAVVKSKVAYTSLASNEGWVAPPSNHAVTVKGTTRFRRSGTTVELVNHEERLEMRLSEQGPPVLSTRRLTLSLHSSRLVEVENSFAASVRGLEEVAFDGVLAADDSQQQEDVLMVDGASFDALLAALKQAANANDETARARLLVRLGAYFRLNPNEVQLAVEEIVSGPPEDTDSTLIGALADAGTEATQSGLSDLARNGELGVSPRIESITALGLVPEPSASTISTLQELTGSGDRQVRSSALLALGAAAGRSRERDRLIDDLLRRWDRSSTADEQVLILEALGNTASPRALPAIEQGMSSSTAPVRGAAYAALRFVAHPSVDDWLRAGMLGDPSPGVRQEILFAVGFRTVQQFMPSLETLLASEQHATVRLEAVALIGARATELSGALALLTAVADNDTDENVRDAAQRYIEDATAPGG